MHTIYDGRIHNIHTICAINNPSVNDMCELTLIKCAFLFVTALAYAFIIIIMRARWNLIFFLGFDARWYIFFISSNIYCAIQPIARGLKAIEACRVCVCICVCSRVRYTKFNALIFMTLFIITSDTAHRRCIVKSSILHLL